MGKTLDIIEQQLELGDVKIITSNGGSIVKFIELLFSPTTKAQFALSDDRKTIDILVSDNNLSMPQLYCKMNKDSLRDLLISLKNIYNQLLDEEENIWNLMKESTQNTM